MKMEYERYSERYRRNETNGNVGIISEDSATRRTAWKEIKETKGRAAPAQKEKTTGKGIVLLVYLCCHAGIDRGIGAERDFL